MTPLFPDDERKRPPPLVDEETGEKVAAFAAIVLLALLAGAMVYASNDPVQTANDAMSQSRVASNMPAPTAETDRHGMMPRAISATARNN
jgi:hypothetical protein